MADTKQRALEGQDGIHRQHFLVENLVEWEGRDNQQEVEEERDYRPSFAAPQSNEDKIADSSSENFLDASNLIRIKGRVII